MLAEERQKEIIKILKSKGTVTISELCRITQASVATLRRDLIKLEDEGMLIRIRGGATLSNRNKFELSFEKRTVKNVEKKESIASKAVELVENGDSVLLDAGTTTLLIAKKIAYLKRDVMIVTNSLAIVQEMANHPDIRLRLIGGKIDWNNMATIGPGAIEYLMDMVIDKVFIGANGVDVMYGAMAFEEENAILNKVMAESARLVCVVADSSKIGKRAFVRSVPIKQIDILITDRKADRKIVKSLKSKGINVLIAED